MRCAGPGALPTDAYQMGINLAEQRRRMTKALDTCCPFDGGAADIQGDGLVYPQGRQTAKDQIAGDVEDILALPAHVVQYFPRLRTDV